MKLNEIANKINKSRENEVWVNLEDVGNDLDVDMPYLEQSRLKCYWVGNWQCTDSYVGYRMYFFDGEPVAFSVQTGRKSSENFQWFSLETATKVRDYLLSLISENENLNIKIVDINEDIGEGFKISYNKQILNKDNVTYNGEKVILLESIKNRPYGIDTLQKIQLANGETKEVEIEELDFGFHII